MLVWNNENEMLVDTNASADGKKSSVAYDHFSRVRTPEGVLGCSASSAPRENTARVMNEMTCSKARPASDGGDR